MSTSLLKVRINFMSLSHDLKKLGSQRSTNTMPQTTIRRVLKFAYEAYKKNQCKFMVTKMKNVRLIQVLFVITVRIDKIGRKVQNLSKS